MRVQVKGRVDDEGEYMLSRRLYVLRSAKETVRKVSFAGEIRIKDDMPVDTGRARASWGHWSPQHLKKSAKNASPADSIWEEQNGGLSISQGSNVPYIEDLNAGTSAKAPAGFIDSAAESMQRELDREIDKLMRLF